MAAMRQLYANTLDDYFDSHQGPAYWAQELYNSQVRRPNMNGLLSNPVSGVGSQKYSATKLDGCSRGAC